jgi:uncharacterized protein with HEPN domain
MRSDRERFLDILEAIENIERHSCKGRSSFETDELIQVWICAHLQSIGEACSQISSTVREQHQDIPWKKIIGMRNILVHTYFDIDLEIVWNVVISELPALKKKFVELVAK